MYLSQLEQELKLILSSVAGTDTKKRRISVTLGKRNDLQPSASSEPGSSGTCISPGFVKFWYNTQTILCENEERVLLSSIPKEVLGSLAEKLKPRDDGTYEGDMYVIRQFKEWRAFFTIRAVRCGSVDMLQRLCFRLTRSNPNLRTHPCVSIPKISDINDLAQIADGLEWQNRADATLSVDYSHTSIIIPECRPTFGCITAVLLDRVKSEDKNVRC